MKLEVAPLRAPTPRLVRPVRLRRWRRADQALPPELPAGDTGLCLVRASHPQAAGDKIVGGANQDWWRPERTQNAKRKKLAPRPADYGD
jgi:hypothetical protein